MEQEREDERKYPEIPAQRLVEPPDDRPLPAIDRTKSPPPRKDTPQVLTRPKQAVNPPPPMAPAEIEITDEIYRKVSLMKVPNRCCICAKEIDPQKQSLTQPPCTCDRANKYHSSCISKTPWAKRENTTCLHCVKENAIKEVEKQAKVSRDKSVRASEQVGPTENNQCQLLALLGYDKYKQWPPPVNYVWGPDKSSVDTDFAAITIDTLKDSGLTYEELRGIGFDINGLKTWFKITSVDLIGAFGMLKHQDGLKDIFKHAGVAASLGITPTMLRLSKVTMDDICGAAPSWESLMALGFTKTELLFTGFTKYHIKKLKIPIGFLIKNLKFDDAFFEMLDLDAEDFEPGKCMDVVGREKLVDLLGIDKFRAGVIGIFFVNNARVVKVNKHGIPFLE